MAEITVEIQSTETSSQSATPNVAFEPYSYSPILPGLPDDVAKQCLALVPRTHFPAMGAVCSNWRSFMRSKEFITVRKHAGVGEEWLYVLTTDEEGKGSRWEVLGSFGNRNLALPKMPGSPKIGFGVAVVGGRLLVIAGMDVGTANASSDVYQYDSCVNSWSKVSSMNVPRYEFACAELNGKVYVVGGYGLNCESLSSAEVYDPETKKWTVIAPIKRPRWGCFACAFDDGDHGKLYVIGGRSSFTIGNSKFVDVYSPENQRWFQTKNGCVMVTAHAVLGKKLFCMEWKSQRKLVVFDPKEDGSWKTVPVPLVGSSSIGFKFGVLDGKLLLLSLKDEPGYTTLVYDPEAGPGSDEWQTSEIKPSGPCLCSVTIRV